MSAPRPFDDLRVLVKTTPKADEAAIRSARGREGQLTKPAGSLGRLEEISAFISPRLSKDLVTTVF